MCVVFTAVKKHEKSIKCHLSEVHETTHALEGTASTSQKVRTLTWLKSYNSTLFEGYIKSSFRLIKNVLVQVNSLTRYNCYIIQATALDKLDH
jgi:hypothetical protein